MEALSFAAQDLGPDFRLCRGGFESESFNMRGLGKMLVMGRLLTLQRQVACAPFLRLCVGQERGYIAAVPVHIPILSVGTGARTHEPHPLGL